MLFGYLVDWVVWGVVLVGWVCVYCFFDLRCFDDYVCYVWFGGFNGGLSICLLLGEWVCMVWVVSGWDFAGFLV